MREGSVALCVSALDLHLRVREGSVALCPSALDLHLRVREGSVARARHGKHDGKRGQLDGVGRWSDSSDWNLVDGDAVGDHRREAVAVGVWTQ